MKTQSHTPTPWHTHEYQLKADGEMRTLINISGEGIDPMVAILDADFNDRETMQANAAFIVRAVNAYGRLLTIAKILNDYFENSMTVNGSELVGENLTLAESVGRAIALAEKGE